MLITCLLFQVLASLQVKHGHMLQYSDGVSLSGLLWQEPKVGDKALTDVTFSLSPLCDLVVSPQCVLSSVVFVYPNFIFLFHTYFMNNVFGMGCTCHMLIWRSENL